MGQRGLRLSDSEEAAVSRAMRANGLTFSELMKKLILRADELGVPTVVTVPGDKKTNEALISPQELVRAGQIAGLLESVLKCPTVKLLDEDAIREWLDSHPLGASTVSELLLVAGVSADLKRWRGLR